MQNILVKKLQNFGRLPEKDEFRLNQLVENPRLVTPGEDIILQGSSPEKVHLVIDGMCGRYKILPDGSRSIMALLLPGDFCDLHVAILGAMDHNIGALTDCLMIDIPRDTIEELLDGFPRTARALWWATLVDEAILREWLVNMGKRRADRQLAHLICELCIRYAAVGKHVATPLPLTQAQIADILGITPVHAQRVITALKEEDLITTDDREIKVPSLRRLREYCDFQDDYLHLNEI